MNIQHICSILARNQTSISADPTDPRDGTYSQSTTVLYTKLDARRDQQATTVSTVDGTSRPRPPSSSGVINNIRLLSLVYIALADGWCFLNPTFGTKFQRKIPLFLDTLMSLKTV